MHINIRNITLFLKRSNACIPIFIALGDEARLKLLIDIAQAGTEGINVTNLAEKSTLSRPTISYHLKVLTTSGLIKSHKKGTQIFYSSNPNGKNYKTFKQTIEFLDSIITQID